MSASINTESKLGWKSTKDGDIPPNAVEVGENCYVARAVHKGEMIPGKIYKGHSTCYVSYGGEEIGLKEYEVLVEMDKDQLPGDSYQWILTNEKNVPQGALIAGSTSGDPLYVARAFIEGDICSGKYYPPAQCAYFPYDGKEVPKCDFEVLCCKPK